MYKYSFRQTWRTQAISFIIVALHFMTCLAEKPCFQYVQKKERKEGKNAAGENAIVVHCRRVQVVQNSQKIGIQIEAEGKFVMIKENKRFYYI